MKPLTAFFAAFVLVASAPVFTQGVILEQVLVKVNGEIFTKTDLEQRQIDALRATNRQVSNPGDLKTDATLKAVFFE